MTLLEQIIEVMGSHKGAAHINDIAAMLIDSYPNIQISPTDLPGKVSATLARDVKKRPTSKASFSKVKNKTGGYKRGVYRLKKRPQIMPAPTLAPTVTTQYTGAAGENAVISELLFYGFNASNMPVDDGIDIVASKDNQYFHIQVKTANPKDDVFAFSIKRSSFNTTASSSTFYIFVMRNADKARYFNDYLIMPSSQVRQFINASVIKDSPSLSLRVHKDNKGRYILNGSQDVTISINDFSQLI